MNIAIQSELKDVCCIKTFIPNDMLEAYIEYASLYSRKYWLILHGEYLRRMDREIAIY